MLAEVEEVVDHLQAVQVAQEVEVTVNAMDKPEVPVQQIPEAVEVGAGMSGQSETHSAADPE
jgi:hypothetical protein